MIIPDSFTKFTVKPPNLEHWAYILEHTKTSYKYIILKSIHFLIKISLSKKKEIFRQVFLKQILCSILCSMFQVWLFYGNCNIQIKTMLWTLSLYIVWYIYLNRTHLCQGSKDEIFLFVYFVIEILLTCTLNCNDFRKFDLLDILEFESTCEICAYFLFKYSRKHLAQHKLSTFIWT